MSTATPPKLETSLDTSSLFGNDDMFDFSGSKKSTNDGNSRGIGSITPTAPKIASSIINTSTDISPIPPPKSYDPTISPTASRFPQNTASAYSNIFTNSQHLDSDRPTQTESSPYHWDSKPTDDLLTSPVNNSPRNSRMLTPGQKSATFNHSRTDSLEAPSSRPTKTRGGGGDSSGLKRASAVMKRSSYDEDAAIVAGSVHRSNGQELHGPRPQPGHSTSAPVLDTVKRLSDRPKDRDSGWEETLPSISSSDNSLRSSGSSRDTTFTSPMMSRGNTDPSVQRSGIDSNHTTPKAKKTGLSETRYTDEPDDSIDVSISQAAALAAQYENFTPGPQIPANKVMTRAQFERYQQQQDDQRRLSGNTADDDDDDSIVSDEEETEVERNRQAAKLRERQDAHLSVYRQQMMKVSGSDQPDTALGMNSRMASMSTSALPLSHHSTMRAGPGSSDGEDEEVPLGILLAHGFPGRNRPPTRLSNASSQPNLRGTAQNQQQDPRLPPFARHLPQDPYNVGAGLVNPMNRMSLAFGGGGDARSVAGGSVYGGMPPSQLPGRGPGGLVGEIVKAEEQKAARKGMGMQFQPPQKDPFTQDPFARSGSPGGGMLGMGGGGVGPNGMPMGMNPGMMGNGMAMGMGGNQMNPGMGMQANDSMQQMQQFMQMQMQMMQMQMQMQQQQPQQMPQPQPQFMMGQQQRPTSVMSMNPQMGGLGVPQAHPRAMSMMEHQFPQMQSINNRASYAPSIAPSHRGPMGGGFLGPGAGYTPSIAPSERSNIGLPPRYRPVSHHPGSTGARTATLTSGAGHDWNGKAHGPSHLKTNVESDEDDESGWEELNRKRKEKKERKKKDGLKGMLHFGTSSNTSTT
ncbi:hypothetical protein EDC01DRAFT_210496 [Geopyxis carbonaria]|nr:hypothetical protein EDC01DRAFT_210496 [Geopyxis carbonaria]